MLLDSLNLYNIVDSWFCIHVFCALCFIRDSDNNSIPFNYFSIHRGK